MGSGLYHCAKWVGEAELLEEMGLEAEPRVMRATSGTDSAIVTFSPQGKGVELSGMRRRGGGRPRPVEAEG